MLCLACGSVAPALGQTVIANPNAQPNKGPKINRHFVPAGRPETWPTNDWVPITPQRLQTLIDQQGRPAPKPMLVEQTRLQASFDPSRTALVNGRGVIAFPTTVPTDRFVTLSPLNVALRKAMWTRIPASNRSVVWGYDEHQQLQLAVLPDAGELQFEWQLAGTTRLNGVEFDLRLPRSVVNEVWIDAPADWSLVAGSALVKSESQANGTVRWMIHAGTSHSLKVLLSPESLKGAPHATATSVRYRQTTTMQLSRGRLDERLDYALDAHSMVPDQWTLHLPNGWRCDGVIINSRLLTENEWSLKAAAKGVAQSPNSQVLSVPLNHSVSPTMPTISIRLTRLFAANERQMTAICPAPQGTLTSMLSGQVELQVASSLSLTQYEELGLRQTELQRQENIERLMFQQDRSGAELNLSWDDRANLLQLKSRQFVSIDLDDNPASFRADLEIEPQSGAVFDVNVGLPRYWEVSEVVPANSSTSNRRIDWTVVTGDPDQQLKLSFPDGLPANTATVLRVNGHFVGAKNNEWTVPIGVLKRSVPENVFVAITSRATNATLVAGSHRVTGASAESVMAARSWSTLAKVTTNQLTRVWNVDRSDQSVNWREIKMRQQVPTELTPPVTVNTPKTEPPKDASPREAREISGPSSNFRPVFSASLRSTLSPGRASRDQHELALKLLSPTESGLLEFKLPPHAQLQHVEWHGQRVAATNVGANLSVALQAPQVNDELQIHYTLPAEGLFLRETYQVDLPIFTVPIDGLEWDVRLPTRYVVVRYPGDFVMGRQPLRPHWLAWLFGPLARRRGDPIFNPLRASAWMPLFLGDELNDGSVSAEEVGWVSSVVRAPRLPDSLAIEVCDRQRLSATAWLILVGTICVGVVLRALKIIRRNLVGIVWLTLGVALSVLVPAAYAELIGATILGSVLACLIPRSLVRRRLKKPKSHDLGDRHFAPTVTVHQGIGSGLSVPLLLAAALLVGWNVLTAQDSNGTQAPVESIDLLVEYEGDRFTPPLKTGLVCIPSSTLNQLIKNVPQGLKPTNALFRSAHYEGEWSINGLSKLKTRWELWLPALDVLRASKSGDGSAVDVVTLPVPLRLFADGPRCRVDGQSIDLIPNADGQSVRLLVPRPQPTSGSVPVIPPMPEDRAVPFSDQWRLVTIETELRPMPSVSLQDVAWTLQVPQTLISEVAIAHPTPTVVRPLFSSGWIASNPGVSNDGHFDPVSQFRLIQLRAVTATANAALRVAMKSYVEPGAESVRRMTQIKYSLERGDVSQVALRLPAQAVVPVERITGPPLRAVQIRRTEAQTVVMIEFVMPQTQEFQIVLPWSLPQSWQLASTPIEWERAVWPQDTQKEFELESHSAALVPAAGFQCRAIVNAPSSLGADAEDEFVADWPTGAGIRDPQIVWNALNGSTSQWRLSPIGSEKVVRWKSMVEVERDSIGWQFFGAVDVAGAAAFVHVLEVDPRLVIESVSVNQDEVNRLAYWTRHENRLFLHLRDRVTGPQTIQLTARETDRALSVISLPKVEWLGAKVTDALWQVLRSRGMSVELMGIDFADPVVASFESTPRDLIDVGTYRVRPGSDATLMTKSSPVISRSWCVGALDLTHAPSPTVDLALHLDPGSLDQVTLSLADWPLQGDATIDLDGDPSARITPVANTTGRWRIEFGKALEASLQLRMRVVLQEIDDMQSLHLAMPQLEGVTEQVAAYIGPTTAAANDKNDGLGEADREVMLQRGILSPVRSEAPLLNWSRVPLDVARASLSSNRWDALPMLVQHEVWLGHRDATSARTTALLVARPEGLKLTWPTGVALQACLVNHVPQSLERDSNGVLSIALKDTNAPCLVELLWSRREPLQLLRIGQWQLECPRFQNVKAVERMAVGVSQGRRAFAMQSSPNSDDAWTVAVKSWSVEMAVMPPIRSLDRRGVIDMFPRGSIKGTLSTFEAAADPNNQSILMIDQLQQSAARFWVVDERLDQILMAIVIALVVSPVIRLLIQFRSGDWLAEHPAAAFASVSLIWWGCLLGSGFGLAALCVSSVVVGLRWLGRENPDQRFDGRLASASPTRSRHTFQK